MKLRNVALMLLCLFSTRSEAKLTITEVMQSNIDNLYFDNEFPDSWIEIHSDSTKNFRLANYRIGTSKDFSKAVKLSASSIARADSFCVIYCDKSTKPKHANMRVDSKKGKLYLFSPKGEILDMVSLPAQLAPNVAYGLDENGKWGFEISPTPGNTNKGGISNTLLPQPIFKTESYVSYDNKKTVVVSVSMPDGVPDDTRLCVTDDGSEPTIEDAKPQNRFVKRYTTSKVIRAKLISSSAISQPSLCRSYILHPRESKLPLISIITNPEYLYDQNKGILAGENFLQDWRRPMHIDYFPANSETATISQLGEMRVQGGWTRNSAQKSFALYANKRFGTKRYEANFWEDKPEIGSQKSFLLRNGGNNFSGARINDIFAQTLFGTHFSNLDWQAYQQAICYINGEYQGIYTLRERSNEDNVEANYDGLEDIDMIENWEEIKAGDDEKFKELANLYNGNPTYEQMANAIDIDNFIKMFIAESWSANTDFPGNNMIMWRERTNDAKWRWLLKDMDFTGYNSPDKVYFSTILRTHNHINDTDEGNRPEAVKLFQVMCSFPEFVDAFAEKFFICLGDFLRSSVTKPLLEKLRDEIKDEYPYHLQVYGNPNSYDNWLSQVNNLINWSKERTEKMPKILADYFNLGTTIPVTIKTNGHKTSFNGTTLTQDEFIGQYLADKNICLQTEDSGKWKVTVSYNDGFSKSYTEQSNSVDFLTTDNIKALSFELIDTSGITDIVAKDEYTISIIPYDNEIYVETVEPISSISLFGIDGKELLHIESPSAQLYIKIGKPGVYIIKVSLKNGYCKTQKLIF